MGHTVSERIILHFFSIPGQKWGFLFEKMKVDFQMTLKIVLQGHIKVTMMWLPITSANFIEVIFLISRCPALPTKKITKNTNRAFPWIFHSITLF